MFKNKGYALVLATACISGISIFANKFGVAVVNPDLFTFLKNSLAAVCLTALFFVFKDFRQFRALSRKHWGILLAIGLVGGSLPFLLFFRGLALSNAAGASFIQKTMFIWIFILAGIFLKEKISKAYLAGGLLLVSGNLLLIKMSAIEFGQGTLLALVATMLWAAENVISKYALRSIAPRLVMWGRMFFGSLFIFVYLAITGQASLLATLDAQQIGWTLLTGALLIGYVMTWYAGLQKIKVTEAAIILMLGSPVTTLLTTVFSKPLAAREYLAMLLIVLGVAAAFGAERIYQQFQKLYVRG